MGILEALTADPEAGLALSAGMIRGDLGGGLAAFGQAVAQRRQREIEAQDRAMKRMLMDAQIQNYQSEISARGVGADKTRMLMDMIGKLGQPRGAGGVPASAADAPPVAAPGGLPQVGGQAAPVGGGAANNKLLGLTVEDVAKLKMLGVDVLDAYKYANDPLQLQPGSTYRNRVTGETETIPQLEKGQQFQSGQVSNLPGYAAALAEQESAKARATEGARAENKLVTVTLPDGRTVMLPESVVLNASKGGGSLGSSAPSPTASPVPPIANPSGYNGGSVDAANAESLRYIDEELRRKDLSPMDRAALLRNRAQLLVQTPSAGSIASAGKSGGPGFQVQGEAERAAAIEQAKADVKPTDQRASGMSAARDMLSVIDMLQTHKGRETATGVSGVLDPRNYIPGTNAKDFRVALDQLKGKTFLQAFESLKGGGQITEAEGKKATDAIARLNTAQSDKAFSEALSDLRQVVEGSLARQQGSAQRSGMQLPSSGGASGGWSIKPIP